MATPTNRNATIIDEFRANDGHVGGPFSGQELLILHTIGARSGQERVHPVVCQRHGDQLVIMASKGGAPTHPDWFHNIEAHSTVTVEFGTETFTATAEITEEPGRTRLFDDFVAAMPSFADYQRRTSRILPVILLTRHSNGKGIAQPE